MKGKGPLLTELAEVTLTNEEEKDLQKDVADLEAALRRCLRPDEVEVISLRYRLRAWEREQGIGGIADQLEKRVMDALVQEGKRPKRLC